MKKRKVDHPFYKTWDNFLLFVKDMGDKPNPTYTLDRINNNKGYSPKNCKWSSKKEQVLNWTKRSKTTSKYKGVCRIKNNKKNPWIAQITVDYKHYSLGYFKTEKKAYSEYKKTFKEWHGYYPVK